MLSAFTPDSYVQAMGRHATEPAGEFTLVSVVAVAVDLFWCGCRHRHRTPLLREDVQPLNR
jgi:hypothetical protein